MQELTPFEINKEFCKEVGIKKACCYLLNKDTQEIRYYCNLSGLYKIPKKWKNVEKGVFKEPCYPDLINNAYNFSALIFKRILALKYSLLKSLPSRNYKLNI